jgi:hypothetical protein
VEELCRETLGEDTCDARRSVSDPEGGDDDDPEGDDDGDDNGKGEAARVRG